MQQCSMCAYTTRLPRKFIYHVVRNHKHDPNFVVQCREIGCGASYNKWPSFKKHIQRKHPNWPVDNELENIQLDDAQNDNDEVMNDGLENAAVAPAEDAVPDLLPNRNLTPQQVMKWHAAKFLVNTREKGRISQRALSSIICGTDELLRTKLHLLLTQCRESADPDTDLISVNVICDIIKESQFSSLFEGIATEHLLTVYLRKECHLLQPVPVSLGTFDKWSKSNPPRVVQSEAFAYTVPYMESLEQLLNNDQVLNCVRNPFTNNSGLIKNFTDGSYYKALPARLTGDHVLHVIFYFDDVTLTNPLSSKVHKVTLFYWMLGNIHPHLRSTLKAINLLGIARSSDVKRFGIKKVLKPFIHDMKKLESPEGYVFNIKGVPERFHGHLFFASGDTPAAQYLGGFKEGVGGARLPCRNCLVTKDELSSKFSERGVVLRTKETHAEHLEVIQNPNLNRRMRTYWSQWYGVNEESVLSSLEYFDVCQCLLQDFMHIVPEGVLPAELLNIIHYCVNNELFELEALNNALERFEYGHLSRDKPARIETRHLDTHLHQSAAQSLTLGFAFPFILEDLVDEWPAQLETMVTNFVRLLQIINLCMCYEFSEDDIVLLSHMIEVHHQCYKILYPAASLTPKFHYMVHFPSQILKFGPLRHSWCFRFEGFHAYFKSLIPVTRNFKNILFTLLTRYLKCRWSDMSSLPDEPTPNFLYPGDIIKEGKNLTIDDHAHRETLSEVVPMPDNSVLMKSPVICINGTSYSAGSKILLNCSDENLPQFGEIAEILVYQNFTILLYKILETEYFENRLNAYKVSPSPNYGAINVKDLIFPHPLPCWSTYQGEYTILLYHRRTEFMG